LTLGIVLACLSLSGVLVRALWRLL
jgi:hypothetical protein